MDLCWDCGKRLKNPIRKYCARCWDKRLVKREKKENAAIAAYQKEMKK